MGKVHAAQIEIGGRFFTSSFAVMENNKVDFLFGLDNMKRHKCVIDLINSKMTFEEGVIEIPFLSDDQVKEEFQEEYKAGEMADSKSMEEKMNELLTMGYEEADAKKALEDAAGNVQMAMEILM